MAFSITVGTLVSRAQLRANRDGDNQIDTTEWKAIIAEKYEQLHAIVAEITPTYFQTEATLNLAALTLPTDFLSSIGVDRVLSGTTGPRVPVYGPVSAQDRTYLVGLTSGDPALAYGIEAGAIVLYPAATSGTYKHLYLPQPTDYSSASDSTTIDTLNTWGRSMIIWGVAAIAAHRGSEDQSRALDEEARAREELQNWAAKVSLTHAPRRAVEPPWGSIRPGWRVPGMVR